MKKMTIWLLLFCLLLIPNQKIPKSAGDDTLTLPAQKELELVIDGVNFPLEGVLSSDESSVASDDSSGEKSKSILSTFIDVVKSIGGDKTASTESDTPSIISSKTPSSPSAELGEANSRKEDGRILVTQSISGEYITTDGEWIYFADISDRYCLSKVRTNGKDAMKCLDIQGVYTINYHEGWLYFWTEAPFKPSTLYKCKPDGSGLTKLSETASVGHNIIYEDFIYFMEKGSDALKNKVKGIRKVKIDGTGEKEIISGNYDGITIASNNLFFHSPDGELFGSDLDGNRKYKIDTKQKKIVSIVTDGESIYCETTYPETMLGVFDTEKNFVQADLFYYCSEVYIFDDYGYYMIYNSFTRRYEIYKMNLDVVIIERILAMLAK